jgi:EAL domain-containing protein (putative c-di-GMP-specific phosphodiesterase class I)
MLKELATAIQNHELHVVYQPIFDSKTRSVTALEALLRWNHPQHGPVSPSDFIVTAESNGLIVELGDWVLQTVCHQISAWSANGYSIPRVCINVSVRQFEDPQFASRVQHALDTFGLQPEQIELELTETCAFADLEAAASTMATLCELGIPLSIDDFGAGATSLSLAGALPMRTLKIDRCLIDAIDRDSRKQAIVSCVVLMSRALGMRTIAEGVDSATTAQLLMQIGCDELQGFYLSHPLHADVIPDVVYPTRAA